MSWFWGPRSGFGVAIAVLSFLADQGHKYWMLEIYRIQERGRVAVTSFLDLVYVKNTGVSYGFLSLDTQSGQRVLIAIAAAASLAMLAFLARSSSRLAAVSIGLIIGGAIGNALDRELYGGVADFFSLHAYGFYWYVFNVADVAIVAGVIGLLYDSFVMSRKKAPDIA